MCSAALAVPAGKKEKKYSKRTYIFYNVRRMCSAALAVPAVCREYSKRTHSMAREHILQQENTFYSKRTHSMSREHIL